MSKRRSANSVLSFDDVLNDINDQLAERKGDNDEIGDNLDELCSEEEEIDSNPNEECLEEEQQSEEPEDNVNRQQRYGPRKQLTCNRNVHDAGSSLDESNSKEIVYMNKNHVLEELFGRKWDIILDRISYLAPDQAVLKTSKIFSIYTLIMILWTKLFTAQTLG